MDIHSIRSKNKFNKNWDEEIDMKTLKIAAVISILAIALSACVRSNSTELEGTAWVLTALGENRPIEGTQLTIAFEDDQVSGNTGCNLFSGSYKVDGDAIEFDGLSWTERGCMDPEGVMEQEQTYMGLLGVVQRFELDGDELQLFAGSQGSLIFERQGDSTTASLPPSPVPPTATAEIHATSEAPAFEPPAGFKKYQAESIGVSVYIPETWLEHTIVEGQYVILQSYPKNKYVGGEAFEPGDTKCDLGLRPEGESMTDLIDQWKSDSLTTILSEEEITLASGQLAIRVEMDSMGRSNSVITEIDGRVVVLTCFGDFTHFDEIAATINNID
jgi:heat shock protein HslJ